MPDAASVYIKAAGGRKQPIRGALIMGASRAKSLSQSHPPLLNSLAKSAHELVSGQRRLAAILFADVVGSSARQRAGSRMAAKLD